MLDVVEDVFTDGVIDEPGQVDTVEQERYRVWFRRPKESLEAFQAFQLYIACLDENVGGANEVAARLKKSASLIYRWKTKHDWDSRYRAYDNERILKREREQYNAVRVRAREWASRRIDIRESGFEVGEQMMKRAKSLLNLPVYDKEVKKTVIAEYAGQEIETVTILNFNQHPRDARLFAESGSRLMRLSADMSTENVAVLAEQVDYDKMSDEEIDAYIDKLVDVRQKTLALGDMDSGEITETLKT